MNKSIILLFTMVLFLTELNAQIMTVVNKDGTQTQFKTVDIDHIEFSMNQDEISPIVGTWSGEHRGKVLSFEFKSDGSYHAKEYKESVLFFEQIGSYIYSGSKLTMTSEIERELNENEEWRSYIGTSVFEAAIDNNSLYLTNSHTEITLTKFSIVGKWSAWYDSETIDFELLSDGTFHKFNYEQYDRTVLNYEQKGNYTFIDCKLTLYDVMEHSKNESWHSARPNSGTYDVNIVDEGFSIPVIEGYKITNGEIVTIWGRIIFRRQ